MSLIISDVKITMQNEDHDPNLIRPGLVPPPGTQCHCPTRPPAPSLLCHPVHVLCDKYPDLLEEIYTFLLSKFLTDIPETIIPGQLSKEHGQHLQRDGGVEGC